MASRSLEIRSGGSEARRGMGARPGEAREPPVRCSAWAVAGVWGSRLWKETVCREGQGHVAWWRKEGWTPFMAFGRCKSMPEADRCR